MATVDEVLSSTTVHTGIDVDRLARAVEALQGCILACTTCADACLQEPEVAELRDCIRLDLSCADVCQATLAVLSRPGPIDPSVVQAIVQSCVSFCQVCGQECAAHGERHGHCLRCAEACMRCEQACLRLLEDLDRT